MSIKPFAFPLPETRLFLAGCRVYKFRIRTSCSRANQKVNKNQATQEIEDAIRVVLENLDHLQPFTTNHFNVFPYKSKWEKVCHLCSRHTGLRVPAYPFLLTLFLEEREAAPLHTAKRPVDEMPTTAGEADAVTPHYSAVRHPKRSRIEPLGGSPDQHSCWRPEAWEELESQFGKRTESRPQPDGLEAMGADKGFPACSVPTPPSPGSLITYSPANKVVIHQERQGPEGVQGKQEGDVKEAEACESKARPPGPSESGDASFMLSWARKIFPFSLFFGHEKK
ncbi:membrane-anchored junction protein-like isoform X3 [Brienomyrus brachyistius]|uniref:membrane-anchored junction protein-like isoform X3 n=1 Tax=Brienomyrus brachyistius TaxID=42636 RepID=UPI0020B41E9D|nr:membrane-anchored junction protein-like isoform X3 [Brienomyrus brachyistius]